MRQLFGLILLGWMAGNVFAQAKVEQDLYIHSGWFTAVNGDTFQVYRVNNTPVFEQMNAVIRGNLGDTLELTVHNQSVDAQGFVIDAFGINMTIPAGDSATATAILSQEGAFLYKESNADPIPTYLGIAGVVYVTSRPDLPVFFWNMREFQQQFNDLGFQGMQPNFGAYKPDYYVLNGNGKPDIANDSTAIVTGNTGDTIRIVMANTGLSLHSIHFHGYHCRAIYSSRSSMTNWEKDTFPLWSYETMVLEMVPDKPGKYPVHDHNLIAVTGGSEYPNGIFLIMDIQ